MRHHEGEYCSQQNRDPNVGHALFALQRETSRQNFIRNLIALFIFLSLSIKKNHQRISKKTLKKWNNEGDCLRLKILRESFKWISTTSKCDEWRRRRRRRRVLLL